MLTAHIGIVSKRKNATKVAFNRVYEDVAIKIKEPCNYVNPTITTQKTPRLNECNYCYIQPINKYYWIDSCTFAQGVWTLELSCDVLGTYKEQIKGQAVFIDRVSDGYNPDLIDTNYITGATPVTIASQVGMDLSGDGCIVVCCAGNVGQSYYMLSIANWARLYQAIFSSDFIDSINDLFTNIVDSFVNTVIHPQDYILSVKWLPIPYAGGVGEEIVLGNYPTGIVGLPIKPSSIIYNNSYSLTAHAHPQRESLGTFCNSNVFRKVSLYVPACGIYQLDSSVLSANLDTVTVQISIDTTGILSGSVVYGNVTIPISCSVGIDIGISDTKYSVIDTVVSGIDMIKDISASNFAGVVSSVGTLLPVPNTSSIAGGASQFAIHKFIRLSETYLIIKSEHDATHGRPLCKIDAIGNYRGFLQTRNASVNIYGFSAEIDEINRLLDAGIFIDD